MCCERSAMASRRSRKKPRRPKYLSLRRQLAPPPPPSPPAEQLDAHERDSHVACLLAAEGDNGGPTLAALLGPASPSAEDAPSPSPPRPEAWEGDGEGLARRALRGRERWVFCRSASSASSASASASEQEASSGIDLLYRAAPQALSLKLDYDEILTAWSDRGSLYIHGDGPQVVPEVHQTTIFVDVGCTANAGIWAVPDLGEGMKPDDQIEGKKEGNREARVMRYKEKRRSRLFSKRIRYEVRKLNAEKRPRVKKIFSSLASHLGNQPTTTITITTRPGTIPHR